ncbi:hypothetical protein M409DRAFT_48508 [Zasmidium cellare ATCC 36951]|uniref:Uncharacterized protein n=1 Tax=Zasmidium cellare ATCC 36951 TaxID=1080233 RepID=A0A6A6D7D5_ZASCE|nr:uncharacterized protein M409DRAFT_48508 [Zasmidium cellare ATCC 36951]KAF2173546.1 hypothetical protein M409DRAFT_48508 [Zasmidium cellare ATCC 36951]
MAVVVAERDPRHLRGIVDMGSNGIRFSISTLQPPTERIMPTLYQHRAGISLYDAQYSQTGERIPIDDTTISAVITSFKKFRRTCQDFSVPEENITVLATEATRTAVNSEEFRSRIKKAVGWDVTILPKEEEGRVGAMGVASSLPEISGLVMDLGGGSTQLSWLVKKSDSEDVEMPKSGAVSMPYGAAAMSRRLEEAEQKGTVKDLREEIRAAVEKAYESLRIPADLESAAKKAGGFTLYLSGGGFRGWGYVLMSQHRVSPYPIPVINGFKVGRKEFLSTDQVKAAAAASLSRDEDELFRISDRRAAQVPAVALLVNVLAEALPLVNEVRFCQGGVREGYLFSSLASHVKAELPLVVATRPVAMQKDPSPLVDLLEAAVPSGTTQGALDDYKSVFTRELLEAFANLIQYHSSHSKDLQATAALRSTTSGILAGVHGVLHESRALIALMLCARWGSNIPPSDEMFKRSLEQLVESPWTLWSINYLGAVAALVASVYPAGITEANKGRLQLNASWDRDEKARTVLLLKAKISADVDEEVFGIEAHGVERVGKKKRWIGGREGIGHRVSVDVSSVSQ